MFAPTPTEIAASNRTGIIAYSFQASDDGQFALVQFVARNKSAFAAISNQLNSSIQTFLPNRDSRGAIQSEFAKRKKNFDLKSLEVLVP